MTRAESSVGTTASLVYLGLGSNLGDRLGNLRTATTRVAGLPDTTLIAQSSVYETEPVGPPDQPWYLNAALAVETGLEPMALLAEMKHIEQEMGRRPGARWGPRLIDIDILLYADCTLDLPDLTIPHRELWNRRFVLLPLLDIIRPGKLATQIQDRMRVLGATPRVHPYAEPHRHDL